MKVVLLQGAEQDLIELRSYLVSNFGRSAWQHCNRQIKSVLAHIRTFPQSGTIPDVFAHSGIDRFRQVLSGMNVIVYEISPNALYFISYAILAATCKSYIPVEFIYENYQQGAKLKQLVAIFLFAGFTAGHAAEPATQPPLRTDFVFEARVKVDKPLVVGQSAYGLRRIVPIIGGTFAGPNIKGSVLPGGADWQFVRSDGVVDIQAKYTLKTDDGTLIMVENRGLRHASPAVMERIGKGELVPPSEYYFRTTAQFEAPAGSKYEWLNRAVFIGVAERQPDAAVLRFYQVQ